MSSSSLARCAWDLALHLRGVGAGDGDLVTGDVIGGPDESEDGEGGEGVLGALGGDGILCVEVMAFLEFRTSLASMLGDLLAVMWCLASFSERGLSGGLSCSSGDDDADCTSWVTGGDSVTVLLLPVCSLNRIVSTLIP